MTGRRIAVVLGALAAAAVLATGCSAGKDPNMSAPGKRRAGQENNVSTPAANPVVVIETSLGRIKAQLWADKAPGTVKNFLTYVDEGFFDGTIFHRVRAGFMIQGGGLTPNMREKRSHASIRNEAKRELRNDRGTLAMARADDVHSATAQFFINLKDNDFLNHKSPTPKGFGYCAFGKVIEGMDVVDRIAKVETKLDARGEKSVPVETIEIHSIRRAQ